MVSFQTRFRFYCVILLLLGAVIITATTGALQQLFLLVLIFNHSLSPISRNNYKEFDLSIMDLDIWSLRFGYTTTNSYSRTISLTLYWNTFQFTCNTTINANPKLYYFCDVSDTDTTMECNYNISEFQEFNTSNGMQIAIENEINPLEIDQLIIESMSNSITIIIDHFCDHKNTESCNQILTMNNISSFVSLDTIVNNSAVVYPMRQTTKCEACSDYIISPSYGGSGGDIAATNNMRDNKVTGIISWGIQTSLWEDTLYNLQWIINDDTQSDVQYFDRNMDECNPFTLSNDDYINGYNVAYGDYRGTILVFGLSLHTKGGVLYECIKSGIDFSSYSIQESGLIIHENYYLTGFYLRVASAIDAIAFKFSPITGSSSLCIDEYKYIWIDNKVPWEEANNYCITTYHTTLATITTERDYQIVKNIQSKYDQIGNIWIGLTDKFIRGYWQWIDGTSCDYTSTGLCADDPNWLADQPNNWAGDQCYAHISSVDHRYNDLHGYEAKGFICNNPRYFQSYTNHSDLAEKMKFESGTIAS